MALSKVTYVDGETVIGAQNLNAIQDEIIANGNSLSTKVDKVDGKGLSSNDYTTTEKTKLAGVEAGATNVVVDATLTQEGQAADAKKTGDELSALKSGSYEDLTAGNAMQLDSNLYAEDQEPYLFRRTGGSVEAGNRKEDTIIGATVAWNQLVQNGNFVNTEAWGGSSGGWTVSDNVCTFTPANNNDKLLQTISGVVAGHKYFMQCDLKATDSSSVPSLFVYFNSSGNIKQITTGVTNFQTASLLFNVTDLFSAPQIQIRNTNASNVSNSAVQIKNVVCFDLTAMFGSTIADRAYALEQATEGSGIAWLKSMGFFTKDYYAYDAGSLQSVKVGRHKTSGFNQWDEEWEVGTYSSATGEKVVSSNAIRCKNKIPVFPNTSYYITKNPAYFRFFWYDASGNYIGYNDGSTRPFATPSSARYLTFFVDTSYGATYKNDICINLSDPSKNGTYEPYTLHTYPLDSSKEFRGIPKLDANNKLYYDGDTYEADGTVTRKYGIVDLGTLTWGAYSASYPNLFQATLSNTKRYTSATEANAKMANYTPTSGNNVGAEGYTNKYFAISSTTLFINDTSYTDAATFKTAMSGVYLVYELATPTSESALPYTTPQICAADGTEEYTDYAVAAGTRDVAVPVGHLTKYFPDQVAKLDGLPWDLSMIAPIENGTTASQAYAQGKYFMHNNQFCKAKTAIASGATFTLGTNYEVTTVADELFSALNS